MSLPATDVEFLDEYARRAGSRSAAAREAVRLLRLDQLGDDYETAWDEWFESGEEKVWSVAIADGLTDEK